MTGEIKTSVMTEVRAGSTAVLNCNSNDYDHNFMFWLVNKTKIIGPDNDFDVKKYKYEVLSGKLWIDNVSPSESGHYVCLSKHLDGSKISAGEVEMVVNDSSFSTIDVLKIVAILVSIIVLIGCAFIYIRLRKQWRRYEGRTVVPVDDTEEDDNDEIYNRTTTAITPVPGPSRNISSEHLLYGIENQGLDTDFNSVFENIQIKTPSPSLI